MLKKGTKKKVEKLMEEGIERGIYSGAVLGTASKDKQFYLKAVGHSRLKPDSRPLKEDDIFDLASLTKPTVTATGILYLVQEGKISLDESVANYLEDLKYTKKKQITFRHLLTHTSGLPGWLPTYAIANSREEAIKLIKDIDLIYSPGERVEYSDLGFMLLGHLIEKITDKVLEEFAAENIFDPLNMEDTFYKAYSKKDLDHNRIVYNERDSLTEKGMCARGGYSFDGWREGFEPGYPNDGNCRYSFNCVSGHAGLFSKVEDMLVFGQNWLKSILGEQSLLAPAVARLAVKNHTKDLKANKGLGWFIVDNGLKNVGGTFHTSSEVTFKLTSPYPQVVPNSSGELFSDQAFGHTGFTGTSLWIDPERNLIIVFLTNRLHPKASTGIQNIRARINNLILSSIIT